MDEAELRDVGATALRDLGLLRAGDRELFERARLAGATILTKDGDFVELVRRRGPPPRILWLTLGNAPTPRVQDLSRASWCHVETRLADGDAVIEPTGLEGR